MSVVDIDVALAHVRADSDEQAQVQIYLDAAEDAAMQFLNRRVYSDADALTTAQSGVPAASDALRRVYATAIESARSIDDRDERERAIQDAQKALRAALASVDEIRDGIVINPSITAAVLLTVGHLYANRENVVAGATAAAIALPFGAQSLLMPYRAGLGV